MTALPDDPTPALLSRLNQNINALGSAIEEIGIWIDQRGSAETSHRINEHIETLSDNSDAIAELLVDLIARWTPGDIQLVAVSDRSRYRECHHTYWLVDGAPDPYLEMTYSEISGGSSSIERFSKRVDRQNLERLAAAKLIEFQVCGVEGSVSTQDMDGLRQVLAVTK
ncbi:hypothetical protein [Pseudomonas paraversuta]|uniref:hypothetical protein n=1 Tax=Pseudomonas paraversuta TaxID=2750624 RepID=UPI002E2D2457|nr:hypothetical protein [Pseudomonas paraversuta]